MFDAVFWKNWLKSFKLLIYPAIFATFRMVLITMLLCIFFGFVIACMMIMTHPTKGLRPNKLIYRLISFLVNSIRSFPFVILIVTIAPLTRLLLGTMIGETAAILPLTIGGTPYLARTFENAMLEVDPQLIEASKAFGLSNSQILYRVILKESIPLIINGTTLASINCIGSTAMAGAIGAGGIGAVALNYGFYSFNNSVLYTCVVITLFIVQLVQVVGNFIYKLSIKNNL